MLKTITYEKEEIKKPSDKLLDLLKNHWDYGLPQWEERLSTQYNRSYFTKPLFNNRFDLSNKDYLKANHSQIKHNKLSDDDKTSFYQTMTKKEFNKAKDWKFTYQNISFTKKEEFQKSELLKLNSDFESYKQRSASHSCFINPKDVKYSRTSNEFFNYKPKARSAYLNPITNEVKESKPNNIWGFDCYNNEKEKSRSSSNTCMIDKRYNYNPILHKFYSNTFLDKKFISK